MRSWLLQKCVSHPLKNVTDTGIWYVDGEAFGADFSYYLPQLTGEKLAEPETAGSRRNCKRNKLTKEICGNLRRNWVVERVFNNNVFLGGGGGEGEGGNSHDCGFIILIQANDQIFNHDSDRSREARAVCGQRLLRDNGIELYYVLLQFNVAASSVCTAIEFENVDWVYG